ncbi:MAG: PAS domain S-box protein [Pseudomonadota bacterium]
MENLIHVLHLEDDSADAELVQASLAEAGLACRITWVQTREEFETVLHDGGTDIILSDYRLPIYDGISALRLTHERFPEIPFIFVSGTMGEEAAIEGLTQGATDYVLKENLSRLAPAVKRALREARNRREHRQAQEALQQSNEILRAIIEAAPVAIIGLDLNGHVHSVWNSAAEKMLGWNTREVMGRPLPSVQADKQEEFSRFREQIRSGMTLNGVEVHRQRRDGTPIDYSIYASPLYDAQSCISGNIAVLVDITERRRAEQERRANLKFFESMDKVNRAIQGADDLEKMMKDLLDVVLSIFDCDRAFLMYPCDPESPTWNVPMECNKPEYPGIRDLKIEMTMDPKIAEKLRILLAADSPVTFGPGTLHALPEDVSKQFGFKCMMAMAIYPQTGSPWEFGIHQCADDRVWTAEEMQVFEAIGRRLADGLSSLLSYRDLRRNEEFLDKVVEYIPNMIFVKDAQTLKFVRFNKAGEQLVGYSRKELLGKTDHDFFPKEEADFFTAKDRQVLDSRKLVEIPEEIIHTRNNEDRILCTKKIPILDDTGVPQYLLGISEDITERKQAEASIRKLSQAIEQSPVSIIITDVTGRIEFVNAAFTKVTGYSYNEVLGLNPSTFKSGETTAEEYSLLWKTIRSGGVWQGEFHNRKKNGELFWEQATIAPVRDADNVITHYVAVKEDITERKNLEDQLRQTQKMEAVGQLAGGVAHDFNNMLGVIIGYAELALGKTGLDDSLRKNLQGILAAGIRSSEITRQLLAFARKQTIVPRILDLNEIVEGMLKLLRRLIGEDIDLVWRPGAKLWPVKMDPSQIDQILANLCVNARDAIAGLGKVTIETQKAIFDKAYCAEHRGFSPGEYVMLAVSDNGSGMDKATMEKIFEPFFTTKGVGKGTGLGLSTVYGIVKQNDGFINAYSEPGHGSTFKIFFPRHTDLSSQEPKTVPESQNLSGQETILVVEDEILHLELVVQILERYGYQVLAASSPGEALLAAQKHIGKIHLLLTDLIMPEMNGRDLSKEITFFCPGIMCLVMSGYTSNVIEDHGILDEGVHFIQKPFSMRHLAVRVRKILDAVKQ